MGALKEKYYMEDNHGKKVAVVIPISQYHKMIDALEELEDVKDVKSYDKAKAEGKGKKSLPAEDVFKMIEEERK